MLLNNEYTTLLPFLLLLLIFSTFYCPLFQFHFQGCAQGVNRHCCHLIIHVVSRLVYMFLHFIILFSYTQYFSPSKISIYNFSSLSRIIQCCYAHPFTLTLLKVWTNSKSALMKHKWWWLKIECFMQVKILSRLVLCHRNKCVI